MENIKIAQTDRSPEINFDFQKSVFELLGESYPEDPATFYSQPLKALEHYFELLSEGAVEFNFQLIYFNSSSARVVMKLFTLLDQTAKKGVAVTINWYFDAEDDSMEMIGDEFGEDLEAATFNLIPIEL